MKNKLLIILLSFVLFSIPCFAMTYDEYLDTTYPDSYYVRFDNSDIKGSSSLYEYFIIQDNHRHYGDFFPYLSRITVYSDGTYKDDRKNWNYYTTFSDFKTNGIVVSSNSTVFLNSISYYSDVDYKDTFIYADNWGNSGDVVPPLEAPLLVSSVEDLTTIIISDVRTLIPMASLVLCLMLSVALLPRLLRRLMG